ncbi:right-handed parallel beta-helix repeat-containing protein [Paenibacillus sp. P2(2022)]|uniref:right-handed parallel beta-helix repeat-containing protein n=1 Tax=Paenibacillus TaxID=44249 RepID=UPI0005EC74D5|nr:MULTISPECIES: right-handed parallel beta-helix repeat-containing protein [Paenibacillus]AUS26820.1 polysaccharide lyase [Paenibacillus polymyxa]KJK30987.1 parallel beta-helix repeat-containing protein [Paenibacillus polymyxa]MDG0053342.1 right-handed parallel beta-helix repeat-containing protein [Paenibacillus sp. P2(2022)]
MKKLGKFLLVGLSLGLGLAIGNLQTPAASAAGTEYYVSTIGSDSNAGTSDAPWKTLQHAADTVSPGSKVYVRGGVYKEKLKITRSGSASQGPIVFASYGNETAIIDGTGLSVSGNEGLIELADVDYVTIQGFEIRNFTTASKNAVPTGIYVHGAGSFINLSDNKIHDIKNTATPTGKDRLGRDAHGIAVYGTKAPASIHNLTISGNELYNLVLGSSESLVLNGNVNGFAVTSNLIHDNDNIGIDLIGFEGTAPNTAFDQVRNGLVKGNRVYNNSVRNNPSYKSDDNSAGGIYVDGGKDNIIEQNYSYNNDIGVEIASEHAGKATSNITVRSNVIYNNRLTGIAMGAYDDERGSTVNSKIVNNTLYKNDTLDDGSGQLLVQYDTRNNVIKNNIFVASSTDVLIYNGYTQNSGNVVDYNLYFAPGGSSGANWTWKDKEYTGFATYKSGTGNDAHSLFVDPKFVNATNGDFHLQPSSPAIDSGSTDNTIIGTEDIDGEPRVKGKAVNIGADE